ncbi:hypothetical protein A9K66_27965 [Mesorhizobium sp. AA23]|nr:hypothetical protein A9K66_27965 [Mesorhizobium sp. AA23]
MTSGHLAEAIAWFAEHEADRRGVDGSPYEVMKRKHGLSFSEAVQVCREVRERVGPYKGCGGRVGLPVDDPSYRCPPFSQSFASPVQPARARMEVNNGR